MSTKKKGVSSDDIESRILAHQKRVSTELAEHAKPSVNAKFTRAAKKAQAGSQQKPRRRKPLPEEISAIEARYTQPPSPEVPPHLADAHRIAVEKGHIRPRSS